MEHPTSSAARGGSSGGSPQEQAARGKAAGGNSVSFQRPFEFSLHSPCEKPAALRGETELPSEGFQADVGVNGVKEEEEEGEQPARGRLLGNVLNYRRKRLLGAPSDGGFSFHALHPILDKFRAFLRPRPLPGERDRLKNRSLIFPLNQQMCSVEKEENAFRDFLRFGWVRLPSSVGMFCFAVAQSVPEERRQLPLCARAARLSSRQRFAFLCGCDAALPASLSLSDAVRSRLLKSQVERSGVCLL